MGPHARLPLVRIAMTARSVAFAPVDPPRLAVAADGMLAAVVERARITMLELPSCIAFAALGLDLEVASEGAWVGTPPRLLVLSRMAHTSRVHLIDPLGPRTICELRLETPMRLAASVGAHALLLGNAGAVVL